MKPVRSVVDGHNGRLIAEAARLWIKPDDLVVDMTYGRGRFWTEYTPDRIVRNDLYKPADLSLDYRKPDDWYFWHGRADVAVFDPPYISTGSSETSTIGDFYDRFGLSGPREGKGWRAIEAGMKDGIHTAATLLAPSGRLFVKCCDYVDGGRRRWGHKWAVDGAESAGLEQVDEFIHHSGTGPQPTTNLDGTPRRQVHSRRAHSFLCVFQRAPITLHSTKKAA